MGNYPKDHQRAQHHIGREIHLLKAKAVDFFTAGPAALLLYHSCNMTCKEPQRSNCQVSLMTGRFILFQCELNKLAPVCHCQRAMVCKSHSMLQAKITRPPLQHGVVFSVAQVAYPLIHPLVSLHPVCSAPLNHLSNQTCFTNTLCKRNPQTRHEFATRRCPSHVFVN